MTATSLLATPLATAAATAAAPDPGNLDRLHDLVAPPPVPWWPPAPGWWWVLGLAAAVVVALAVRGVLAWQWNRYRREALAELAWHATAAADPGRRRAALAAVADLLKRCALSAWPRREVAALTGRAWFAFLDRTGRTDAFTCGNGPVLEAASYDPRSAAALPPEQVAAAVRAARDWVVLHRRPAAGRREAAPC